jgi:hypothetical protein
MCFAPSPHIPKAVKEAYTQLPPFLVNTSPFPSPHPCHSGGAERRRLAKVKLESFII